MIFSTVIANILYKTTNAWKEQATTCPPPISWTSKRQFVSPFNFTYTWNHTHLIRVSISTKSEVIKGKHIVPQQTSVPIHWPVSNEIDEVCWHLGSQCFPYSVFGYTVVPRAFHKVCVGGAFTYCLLSLYVAAWTSKIRIGTIKDVTESKLHLCLNNSERYCIGRLRDRFGIRIYADYSNDKNNICLSPPEFQILLIKVVGPTFKPLVHG